MTKHAGGNWTIGTHGAIVTDAPYEDGLRGYDDTEYYGGYAIAESVSPSNRPLLSAAKDMYEFLSEIEWADGPNLNQCPICSARKKNGHQAWCDLGRVLRKARGEVS